MIEAAIQKKGENFLSLNLHVINYVLACPAGRSSSGNKQLKPKHYLIGSLFQVLFLQLSGVVLNLH